MFCSVQTIDEAELERVLDSAGILFTSAQIAEIMQAIDADKSNGLDFLECLEVYCGTQKLENPMSLRKAIAAHMLKLQFVIVIVWLLQSCDNALLRDNVVGWTAQVICSLFGSTENIKWFLWWSEAIIAVSQPGATSVQV